MRYLRAAQWNAERRTLWVYPQARSRVGSSQWHGRAGVLDAHLRELGRGTAGHLRHGKLAELLLALLKLALELRLAPVAQLVHLDLGCKRQRGARDA